MRKLFYFLLLYVNIIIVFAESDRAIVMLNPRLNDGLTCEEAIQKGVWKPYNKEGAVRKCKKGKSNSFTLEMRKKYQESIDYLLQKTYMEEIKVVKFPNSKADYQLTCNFSFFFDELQQSRGDKAIYTMWLSCEMKNVITGEIIGFPGEERVTKWTLQNGTLLSSKDLVRMGTSFLKNKFPTVSDMKKTIEMDIDYIGAKLKYKYNDENRKEANGKEKGILTISNIIKKIEWGKDKPRNLTEFTLMAKQGKFTETQSNEITFIPFDYMKSNNKLEYEYQTYNCNQKGISDKVFETFLLKRTSQLNQKDSVVLAKLKVPFECPKPYYTLTTTKRTTRRVKPLETYRGMEKELKSYEEDKEVYYIYIDIDRGKIEQYHVDEKSSRKIHKEVYELNMKRCQYEVVTKDKLVKNLGGSPLLKSEDSGWGFEDDTRIYVELPEYGKRVSFLWGSLREQGHYRTKVKYKKQIPQFVKDMMGRVNDMATLYRNETKHSKEIEHFKNLYEYPGTPREVQCGGKVAMESLLIPPLDGWQDLEVTFQLDIRPSSKSEIEVMKKYRGVNKSSK